jgi:predicted NUDIX family phosphoesterase
MTAQSERVLVVPRADWFAGDWPQGLFLGPPTIAVLIPDLELGAFFVDRARAEEEPAWKQLIPYCVVTCGPRVLCVERLRGQGERRLHRKLSIGIGGHVNPADGPPAGRLRRGMWRELAEELVLRPPTPEPSAIGLLNDDSNPVGRVHAGVVFRLELRDPAAVGIREISKMAGGFRSIDGADGLWQDRSSLETWSRLLLESGLLAMDPRGLEPDDG